MSGLKAYKPGGKVTNARAFLRMREDSEPLFTVAAGASADELIEFAATALDAVKNRIHEGCGQGEIDSGELWVLGHLLEFVAGAYSAVVGEP
jgi:hypothetical protein